MRELRGAGMVTVEHIPTEENPADIFTKILSRQVFERHRRSVLNVTGGQAPATCIPSPVRDEIEAGSRGGSVPHPGL